MITTHTISIGKTDRRNDDMVFCLNLFNYQALGLIGDFTSDSSQGANRACLEHLSAFVAERVVKWREMFLPPERLLPLLVRHTNDWLADYGPKVQTTLIVFIWDLKAERCHFISIGDSGLAVVGPSGVRFLREGDRQGLRIAAGFLPGQPDLTVYVENVAADECLFAFTDGFWENTTSFMNDRLIQQVFQDASLTNITESLWHHVLNQAIRKDDLSMILMKGDEMTQQPTPAAHDGLDRKLRDEIERQLTIAIGAGQLENQVTPLEQSLLQSLGDASALEQRLRDSLLPQVSLSLQEGFQKQLDLALDKLVQNHMQDLKSLKNSFKMDLEAQNQTIQSLQAQLRLASASQPPASQPPLLSKRTPQPGKKLGSPRKMLKGRNDKSGFKLEGRNLYIFGISVAIVIFGIGLWFWRIPDPELVASESYVKRMAAAQQAHEEGRWQDAISSLQLAQKVGGSLWSKGDQETLLRWQQDLIAQLAPISPKPPDDSKPVKPPSYQAAKVSELLLSALAIDHDTYLRQTHAIQRALDALVRPVKLPSKQVISLPDCGDLNKGAIVLHLSASSSWIQTRPVAKERVAKVWLQASLGMKLIDSNFGPGTKNAFESQLGEHIKRANSLGKAMDGKDLAALDVATSKAFYMSDESLQLDLLAVADSLLTKGGNQMRLTMEHKVGSEKRSMTVILKRASSTSELGSWLKKVAGQSTVGQEQIGLAVRILWLGYQANLQESDGAVNMKLLKQVAPFGGKTGTDIYNEVASKWQ